MKKGKAFRKILSIALIMVMVLGTSVTGFAATTFSDINGHWAAASINYGVANGFIKGYADGTFKPDNPVTRAEFSRMLNVAFGIANTQAVNFYDVASSEWYYQEVRKAVAAGYINGYEDNTFRPNSRITRQEAAVMIASVIPAAATAPSLAGLSDNGSIADWARAAVTKVYAKGYMRGDNNNMYNPLKSLTRAEAATILSSIISKENIVSDDTTLSTNGKSISDTIYANDLIISKTLGTGSVDLSDSMVLGTMSVLGGGTGSIGIYDTNIHNMSVAKTTGDVRVFLSGDATVRDTVMENGAILEHKSLRGLGFQNVYFNGSDLGTQEVSLIGSFKQLYINTASTIKATSGSISNVNITRDAAGDVVKLGGTYNNITFEGKSLFELLTGKITALTVNSGASSSTVKLDSGTSITTAVVDGIKTAFTGTGTISRLEANVNDITYETAPSRVVTASGVSRPPVLSADTTAPVPTFVPANSATSVLANTKITITFDEPIYKSNGNAISTSSTSSTLTDIQAIVQLRETSSTGTSKPYAATISSDKKTITLTPNAVLAINTNYYVIILDGTIEDANGNENSKITSTFKTGTTDVAAPVPTFTPANGATNVALNASIIITFDEAVVEYDNSSLVSNDLNTKSIVLLRVNSSGDSVAYTAQYDSANRRITLTPNANLANNTVYYVAIKANTIKDSAGNVVPLTSINFTTIPVQTPITAIAAIGGTAQVGLTLTVGALTPPSATATYQWQIGNSSSGTFANISGATGTSYSPITSNAGNFIRVIATGTGSFSGTVTSNATTAVLAQTPITTIESIVGTAQVGATLTAGSLTPSVATATYQWQISTDNSAFSNIIVATGTTYTPSVGDVSKFIKVIATGTGSFSGTVASNATPAVLVQTPISTIGAIVGTAQVGVVLTAGALSPTGATATYQWQSSSDNSTFSNIQGATGTNYTPLTGDLTKYIRVIAVGTGVYSGTFISASTGGVAAAAPVSLTGISNISGIIKVGSVLTAGALSPLGATATYQWMISDTSGVTYASIEGATGNTYTLQTVDLGKYLIVIATGNGSFTGTATSAATTVVEAAL